MRKDARPMGKRMKKDEYASQEPDTSCGPSERACETPERAPSVTDRDPGDEEKISNSQSTRRTTMSAGLRPTLRTKPGRGLQVCERAATRRRMASAARRLAPGPPSFSRTRERPSRIRAARARSVSIETASAATASGVNAR